MGVKASSRAGIKTDEANGFMAMRTKGAQNYSRRKPSGASRVAFGLVAPRGPIGVDTFYARAMAERRGAAENNSLRFEFAAPTFESEYRGATWSAKRVPAGGGRRQG